METEKRTEWIENARTELFIEQIVILATFGALWSMRSIHIGTILKLNEIIDS